jgi:hypothetical protein
MPLGASVRGEPLCDLWLAIFFPSRRKQSANGRFSCDDRPAASAWHLVPLWTATIPSFHVFARFRDAGVPNSELCIATLSKGEFMRESRHLRIRAKSLRAIAKNCGDPALRRELLGLADESDAEAGKIEKTERATADAAVSSVADMIVPRARRA